MRLKEVLLVFTFSDKGILGHRTRSEVSGREITCHVHFGKTDAHSHRQKYITTVLGGVRSVNIGTKHLVIDARRRRNDSAWPPRSLTALPASSCPTALISVLYRFNLVGSTCNGTDNG